MQRRAQCSLEVLFGFLVTRRDCRNDLSKRRRKRIDCANPCRRTEPSFRLTSLLKRRRR